MVSIPMNTNRNGYQTFFIPQNPLPNAINIMVRNEDDKIETWLGFIFTPKEAY